jgi:hypothetical protein
MTSIFYWLGIKGCALLGWLGVYTLSTIACSSGDNVWVTGIVFFLAIPVLAGGIMQCVRKAIAVVRS